LGLGIGAARLLIQLRVGVAPVPAGQVAANIAFGMAMIPSPLTLGLGERLDPTFPLDPPAWSLWFEVVMNIIYALAWRHLSRRVLIGILLVCGVALLVVILGDGKDGAGPDWRSLVRGVPRAAFPFFLGIFLQRLRLPIPRLKSWWGPVLALVLCAALLLEPGHLRVAYDLGMVFVAFPALVLLGAGVMESGMTARLSFAAGAISYALYIIHFPVMQFLNAVLTRVGPAWHTNAGAGPVFLALLVGACYLIDRFYDTPVRRWLTRRAVSANGM
jgi:peptidoglycan/LPS O-acetylase OafA/YrhL